MKNLYFILCVSLCIISCDSDDNIDPNCNFLLRNLDVTTTINLNLPQFSQLQFISNSVLIPGIGNGGLIVSNTGVAFMAWDAADPNRPLESCSRLSIVGGLTAVNSCEDENMYSLATGEALNDPSLQCTLINYRVQQEGSTLFISN